MALARRRTASLPPVRVLEGTAQALPLPDASVDVAHARWAYFFGPGAEPGLREPMWRAHYQGTLLKDFHLGGLQTAFHAMEARGAPRTRVRTGSDTA